MFDFLVDVYQFKEDEESLLKMVMVICLQSNLLT